MPYTPGAATLERLARFTPIRLSPELWSLARGPVRAAVLAAQPTGAQDVTGLASRLCLFLDGPCGWDRATPPDLGRLLGIDTIARHLDRCRARGLAPKTRENHRADLQRLARANCGTPVAHQRAQVRAATAIQPVLDQLATASADLAPQPGALGLTVVAAAYQRLTGQWLTRGALSPLAAHLADEYAATATGLNPGTIAVVRAFGAQHSAADLNPRGVTTTVTRPTTRNTATPAAARVTTRPVSRAAALRQARENAATTITVLGGPQVRPAPPRDTMADGVADAIEGYTPVGVPGQLWEHIGPLCRHLVAAYGPPSPTNARNIASHVVPFLRWARTWNGRPDLVAPLELVELLRPGLIEAYLVTVAAPDATIATKRSALRRCLARIRAGEALPRIAYQPVALPYRAAECTRFRALALHQPTDSRRRELCAVVGLGLGAGLVGTDLRHVPRANITGLVLPTGRTFQVVVGGTQRPRRVIVRAPYVPLVRTSLVLHDDAGRSPQVPLLGHAEGRRSITASAMANAVTATAGEPVAIDTYRLRSTWLVSLMSSPIPLAALLAAAGLRSGRSLVDLLAHCPAPDPRDVDTLLHHAGHPNTDTDTDTDTERSMIPEARFNTYLAVVRRSGVPELMEAVCAPKKAGGRPRKVGIDVILTACLVNASRGNSYLMTKVHRLLTEDLSDSLQVTLGVRAPRTPAGRRGEAIDIRPIRYLFEKLEEQLTVCTVRAPGLSAGERAKRTETLHAISDALLTATMPTHTDHLGHYALDATAIRSWGRPCGNNGDPESREGAFDKDARFGYQTKTVHNQTKDNYGYEILAMTRVEPVRQVRGLASLIERIRVVAGNVHVAAPSLSMIDDMLSADTGVVELLSDRGFTYTVAEDWAYPLRERNIHQVLDLHQNDYGVHDFEGIKMVAGTPHCPRLPEDLHIIIKPAQLSVPKLGPKATAEDRVENNTARVQLNDFRDNIALRDTWAFTRKASADPTGKERWQCPARAGKVRCGSYPLSLGAPQEVPLIIDPPLSGDAPKACRQATITIPGNVTPKIRQQLTHGSDDWITSYNRRSAVEGSFGNLKNTAAENLNRGSFHVVGLVKTTLVATISVAAMNIRLARLWAQRAQDFTDPTLAPYPAHRGFEENTENNDTNYLNEYPTAA